MPDEEPRVLETGFDAGDLVGVGDDRVFVTGLPRFGGARCPRERLPVETWNCTSWMWIGWASAVKLCSSQTSTASRTGVSVIGSSQSRGTGWPSSSTVPSWASTGPTPARMFESSSLSETRRVTLGGPRSARAGSVSWSTGRLAILPGARHDDELEHLARRLRVGGREVRPHQPPAERLVRPFIDQEEFGARGHLAEIDDDVGALGRRQQELVEGDRRRQESAVGPDLVKGQRRRTPAAGRGDRSRA